MSFMAVSIWVESIQSYGSGILKTAGAQHYAMIFNLICFYLLGMPLGYYFMFKSGLKALGKISFCRKVFFASFFIQILYFFYKRFFLQSFDCWYALVYDANHVHSSC